MTDLYAEALATFTALYAEAQNSAELEASAMTVATASVDGRPSARTVLLKAFDARGFVFYTHLDSAKGRDLQTHPQAALLFLWRSLREAGIQVRIEGGVQLVSADESDAYFASRPRMSQIGAWASLQSQTLGSREEFDAAIAKVEATFRGPRGAAPGWLGRVPGGAAGVRVLVRRQLPPARALALRGRCGQPLEQADAVSVSAPAGWRVRAAVGADAQALLALRLALWPDATMALPTTASPNCRPRWRNQMPATCWWWTTWIRRWGLPRCRCATSTSMAPKARRWAFWKGGM